MQRRAATIICHLPHRERLPKVSMPRVTFPSVEHCIDISQHAIIRSGPTLRCVICDARMNENGPHVRRFLATPCVAAINFMQYQPKRVPKPIMVGNKITHESHNLFTYRGVVFCQTCGFTAQRMLKGLAAECRAGRERTQHGQRCIDAIAKGNYHLELVCGQKSMKVYIF